jgi:hypothetical protein
METVLQVESKNMNKLKEVLNKDDLVSRASITFREGSMISKEGYFCLVQGSDEQCKKAVELAKDIAKEADKKDAENLISKIREEEEKASAGMGSIFG